jgi:hypothetical protein
MRYSAELREISRRWSADVILQVKKIPSKTERLRLLIEAEKVSLLAEIAQGIAEYHESQ